ncbi:MAG TPA: thiamine pyrophosphate-dependent enzyme, partial [Phycisphaerae bacterium]|nr:thiamine pyrophosphate-dependent enzyme [Phycisphaerae bacterium]
AGAAFGGARVIVTMKHVGLNVAADPLFTLAYTGVSGALVIVSADDPGMASSQNEQDNRRYALAAGIPMLEPADSQEAYDFTAKAIELSEKFATAVILRMTTRVCHSRTVVAPHANPSKPKQPQFVRDRQKQVMIPAYARLAHKRLRQRLADIQAWNETSDLNRIYGDDSELGIIASGITAIHTREAASTAKILKIGMTYPLPIETVRKFAGSVNRCLVIEEGDPFIFENIMAAGIAVEKAPKMYRFGELSVHRIQRILANDTSPEAAPPKGKAPELCPGCPHRKTFEMLRDMGCIVAGDIGCYTLGVLPPFEAIDTCVCMGASIGVGLGLRHVLNEEQARKVVSVIGDSTFMHSGITGIVEMAYNPPKTGHVVLILDNSTTAMTGLQENPATGRKLDHTPANRVSIENLCRSLGVKNIFVFDPVTQGEELRNCVMDAMASNDLTVVIVRRSCILAAKKYAELKKAAGE